MKFNLPLCSFLLLLAPFIAQADMLITGTPGDDLLATPTGPIPNLGGILLTFSTLTDGTVFNTYTSQGVTISSPDGLEVEPYSTQSNPNFLVDLGSNGQQDLGNANTTISVSSGVNAIGVGIADSDTGANIMLQALGAGGVDLGSPFAVTITESGPNPGNGYFVVADTTADIYGLQITETNITDQSGLAIADVQVVPELPSWLLLAVAMAMMGSYRLLLKRA